MLAVRLFDGQGRHESNRIPATPGQAMLEREVPAGSGLHTGRYRTDEWASRSQAHGVGTSPPAGATGPRGSP